MGKPVPPELWDRHDIPEIEMHRYQLLLPLVQGYRELLWWNGSDQLTRRQQNKVAYRLTGIGNLISIERDIEAMEPQEPKVQDWEQWKAALSAQALASLTMWSGQTHDLGLNYVNKIAAKVVNKEFTQKTLWFEQLWIHYRSLP